MERVVCGIKKNLSVDFFEKEYKPNWRREERDRIWFVKRKTVIGIAHDLVDVEAVERLDEFLVEDGRSPNYLAQNRKKVVDALK